MATEKKREEKKHSNAKEPYKSGKKPTTKQSHKGQTAWWKKTSAKSLKEVLITKSSHTKY